MIKGRWRWVVAIGASFFEFAIFQTPLVRFRNPLLIGFLLALATLIFFAIVIRNFNHLAFGISFYLSAIIGILFLNLVMTTSGSIPLAILFYSAFAILVFAFVWLPQYLYNRYRPAKS